MFSYIQKFVFFVFVDVFLIVLGLNVSFAAEV